LWEVGLRVRFPDRTLAALFFTDFFFFWFLDAAMLLEFPDSSVFRA
jgi:hypothetical protein